MVLRYTGRHAGEATYHCSQVHREACWEAYTPLFSGTQGGMLGVYTLFSGTQGGMLGAYIPHSHVPREACWVCNTLGIPYPGGMLGM